MSPEKINQACRAVCLARISAMNLGSRIADPLLDAADILDAVAEYALEVKAGRDGWLPVRRMLQAILEINPDNEEEIQWYRMQK